MSSYKLFLDDYRKPLDCLSYMHSRIGKLNPIYLEDWVVVKNYDEFIKTIKKKGKPEFISYDHDLADEHYQDCGKGLWKSEYREKTGLDCAKWYINEFLEHPEYAVHSMNPIGAERIQHYIESFKKRT